MPDDVSDLLGFLKLSAGSGDASATNTAPATAITLAPATSAALDEQTRKLQASQAAVSLAEPTAARQDPDFATKMGAQPGVPFDTTSGVGFMTRLRNAYAPTPADEEKALKAAYGNVRRNSYGYLIVNKMVDGKRTDVLVDPIGLEWGDVAAFAGEVPKLIGAALGTAGAGKLPIPRGFWKSLANVIGMATGGAAAGGTQDVIDRLLEGNDIQPTEIAARRGKDAVVDAAVGGVVGAGTKAVTTLVSPFSAIGPLQTEARLAQQLIESKHGVNIALTPAEATGSGFLGRAEALEMNKPGAQTVFNRLIKAREDAVTGLRNLVTGGAVPDEEAAGQRALDALGAKTAPLEFDVQRAAAAATIAAENELAAGTGAPVNKVTVGNAIDTAAKAAKSDFDTANAANYNAFFSNPLASQPVIEGRGLKKAIDELRTDLPKVRKAVEVPTYDTYGNPTARTVEKDVPVETPVRPRLDELSSKLAGGKVSINDLKQIRTDVDNAIKTGEAVPGVKEGRLKALYSSLSNAIDQGLTTINDPQLTAAWQKATGYYKANVGRFQAAGINELFRDPSNALGPTALVERATSSPDTYAAYRDFFGASSVPMRGIHQAIRDDVLGVSSLNPRIDAAGFVQRLQALDKSAPQALEDAFGVKGAQQLRASAQTLRAARGETLPVDELTRAVNSGNLSATRLTEMISAQNARDAAYHNSIVKAVGEGNLKGDSIKPTDFVNAMVFKDSTQPRDLAGAMALLHDRPEVVEDIRRLAFTRVLDDATVVSPSGARVINANKLEAALSDPQQVKRLQTALGASTYEDLTLLRDVLKPSAAVQAASKGAGVFGASAQIAGLVERGAWKYVDRSWKNFVIASIYTSPQVKALVTNTLLSPEAKSTAVNAMIASTPFLEALQRTYGKQAERVATALGAAARGGAPAANTNANAPASTDQQDLMNFLRK